jgi:uncharacterized protein (DUF433 family)
VGADAVAAAAELSGLEGLMNVRDPIHSDPAILCGKPVVRGTRLSVEFLLELVAAGWTDQQILDSYPHLPPDGLQAVHTYSVRSS